jgi:hypothetical protein
MLSGNADSLSLEGEGKDDDEDEEEGLRGLIPGP